MGEQGYIAMEEGERFGIRIGRKLKRSWAGRGHDIYARAAIEQFLLEYASGDPERLSTAARTARRLADQLEAARQRTAADPAASDAPTGS